MFSTTLGLVSENEQGTFSTTFSCALIIIIHVLHVLALNRPAVAGRWNPPEWIGRRFCDNRYGRWWRATKKRFNNTTTIVIGTDNAFGRDTIPTTIHSAIPIILDVI